MRTVYDYYNMILFNYCWYKWQELSSSVILVLGHRILQFFSILLLLIFFNIVRTTENLRLLAQKKEIVYFDTFKKIADENNAWS